MNRESLKRAVLINVKISHGVLLLFFFFKFLECANFLFANNNAYVFFKEKHLLNSNRC